MISLAAIVVLQGTVNHTFTFTPTIAATRVTVAGTFNNWNKDAQPMRSADGRTWTVTVPLAPGKHLYKFVVNDSTWLTDPKAVRQEDDGNGNTNSVVVVKPEDYVREAAFGDGLITASALSHSTQVPDLNVDRGQLTVTLRVRPNDIANVSVVSGGRTFPLRARSGDDIYQIQSTALPWNGRADVRYIFRLQDGGVTRYFGPKGLTDAVEGNEFVLDSKTFRPFEVPGWVERSVFYQVFPDRFENGDKRNDPKGVMPWDGKPEYFNFFGGDIAGLRKRVPYLRSLGIGAIYFNPIFESPSNHGYETIDYLKIEPRFGSNEEFAQMTRELRRAGIRTILDGVFNHTATTFPPFADLLKNQQNSRYRDWFFVKSWPVKVQPNPPYQAWNGFESMPKVNLMNAEARAFMLYVPKFWHRNAQIAGWRLDVANEVEMDFWRAFRQVVKANGEDQWILGEHWGDSTPWLRGDQWDSAMNYPFLFATVGFLGTSGSGRPSTYMSMLMNNYGRYAPQVSRNLMNLISSHDVPRILTQVGGDLDLAHLAAILQFTWVGSPSVYYGDELGMAGGADPDNRRGMAWQTATDANPTLRLYRRLAALRNASRELQSGDPLPLLADDANQTLAFARVLGERAVVTVVNRSTQPRTVQVDLSPLPNPQLALRDVLNGLAFRREGNSIFLSLAPKSGAILAPSQEKAPISRRPARAATASSTPPTLQVQP